MSRRRLEELPIATDLSDLDLGKGVVALTWRGDTKRVPWEKIVEIARKDQQ